ncbi:SBBP repeat-containing protein [Cystobacter fuscus]
MPAWLRQYGTTGEDAATGIAASCEGVYSIGYTNGIFDGKTPLGGTDSILLKHDLSGKKLWSRQFGGSGADYAVGVASFDLNGRCVDPVLYVAGYTSGSVGGGTSLGKSDIFLVKYNKSGLSIWTRQFGTASQDTATAVATDNSGNVYVVGYTQGAFATPTSAGGQDFFLVKFDATGKELWRRQLGTDKNEQARGVACDANGNVYVGGHTFGNLDGNINVAGNTITSDMFLTKYDSTGLKLWTKQLGTTTSEVVQGLATSRRANGVVDIYLIGHTLGNFANPSKTAKDYDGLLVKFNDAGTVQWKKQLGTLGDDLLFGVTSDGGGTVYVTGTSPYDISNKTKLDSNDVFMMSFKEDGDLVKMRQIGSINPADPLSQFDYGAGIATDKGSGVYIAGYTEGQFAGTVNAGGESPMDLLVFKYEEGCSYNTPGKCTLGYGWGDPHFVTFDGVSYDFQGFGEFILAEAVAGDLVIQARQKPWNGSSHVTVFAAFATKLGKDRVGYYLGDNPPVRVNGVPVNVSGTLALTGGGRIIKQGDTYTLVWPTGDHLMLVPSSNYVNAHLRLSPSRAGKMRGPLGNFNGNRSDDFALRNGTALSSSLSFTQMYMGESSYVNSWRIVQAESLFDYGPGETSASFTDFNFPTIPPPPPTLAQEQQALQICQGAGVTDSAILNDCITDVVSTGDASFAMGAASTQTNAQAQGNTPPANPAPRTLYLGNFENNEASNWTSQVTSSSPAGDQTFLGEFGNESVQLSLPTLPGHKNVTVSFDLYVLNGWVGNKTNSPNRFTLAVQGGAVLLDTTFSNNSNMSQSYPGPFPSVNKAGTGALGRNTLYYPGGDTIYRLKYTFAHTASNLALVFGVQNLSGLTGEAWGLDNVEIQIQ